MRTLGMVLLVVNGIVLGLLFGQNPTPAMAAVCAVLFISAGVLASRGEIRATMGMGGLVVLGTALNAYILTTNTLALDPVPALIITLVAALLGYAVVKRLWGRLEKIYATEVMLVSEPLGKGMQAVAGPAWVYPMSGIVKLHSRLPRYQHETTVILERVNTKPREGPLGLISQNIGHMTVELAYSLNVDECKRVLKMPNQDKIFGGVAKKLGKTRPIVFRDRQFWSLVWEEILSEFTERAVRTAVHRSGLTAHEVSARREELEAAVMDRLYDEAADIGLELLEFNILEVTPDEEPALLHSRETLARAMGQAQEIELTGEAQARARGALMREIAEVVQASEGKLSPRTVELLIKGALPHPILSAYLRDGLLDLPDPLTETPAQPASQSSAPKERAVGGF